MVNKTASSGRKLMPWHIRDQAEIKRLKKYLEKMKLSLEGGSRLLVLVAPDGHQARWWCNDVQGLLNEPELLELLEA